MRTTAALAALTSLLLAASGRSSCAGTDPAACFAEVRRCTPASAAAVVQLAGMDSAGREQLRRGLGQGGRVAALCAWAIWQKPAPDSREALEALLLGSDQVAGYWAARALGAIGEARSVPALADLLADERNAYWELSAGPNRMLTQKYYDGQMRQVYAPDWMPNVRVAYAAMLALGEIGGANAAEVLRAALQDPQYLIRHAAVRALGTRREADATEALRKLAEADPVLLVREAAKEALARIEGEELSAPSPEPDLPPAIAFVKAKNRTESNLGFRDSYFFPKTPWYAWGENLYTLTPATPDGVVKNLTNLERGAVQGPEVSFDGQRILFAMRRDFETDGFHIFEINTDGTGVRQLTFGNCNDADPCYLPDGRIAFCSDRAGYQEYYHQERSRVLYAMDADGGNVEQLTFNPNQDYEPLPLSDGRILYSSYRFYAQDGSTGPLPTEHHMQRIETVLRVVDPDGANDQHLYGSMRGSFYTPLRPTPDSLQYSGWHPRGSHVGVSISQARERPDGRLVCLSPAGLTVVDPKLDPQDCELPLFPEVLNLSGGEEVYIHNHDDMNPVGRFTTPCPLDNEWTLVSHAPWYDLSPSGYDLYLMNLRTRELKPLLSDADNSLIDPLPLRPRPTPRVMPRLPALRKQPTGFVYCNSVFNSDVPYDRSKPRFVRVLEALPMGLSLNANANFRSRVLGTAPLEEDGSFYVEIPADTPFRFQLLDLNEEIVVHETEFNYVRGGERKGCIGCHEPKNAPPLNDLPQAMRHQPFKTVQRGGLIYQGQTYRPYSLIVR
jgi:hypothetical protein